MNVKVQVWLKHYNKEAEVVEAVETTPESEVCSICLGDVDQDFQTKCKHYFHAKCLEDWKRYKENCPLCRRAL